MKKPFIDRLFWVLNIIVLVALILSYLAAYISPAQLWWLALFGLAYGTLLVINLCFVIFWILRKNKKYRYSLFISILGIGKIFGMYQPSFSEKLNDIDQKEKGRLKVMSFNVRLFDLYNWFHSDDTRSRIFSFLKSEQPDVICFQEFFTSDRGTPFFKNDDTLRKMLSAYTHIEYTLSLHAADHFGIATYSKYPIVNKQAVHFQKRGGNIFIYTDIKVGEDTIRVFNTHLESIRFHWEDYKFIQNLGNDEVEQDEVKGGLTILRRLKKAFVKRAIQVQILHDTMDASPYPIILCGDFNDTPPSYTYHILADDLKDAYRESGSGFGKTYSGPFPSFRIDYIFHDKRIKSFGYKTIREKLSDHYPISCWVELP
ncbi:MAG: endonuclease/exonuclease/phosphatase family protein [Bacteroidetes bacterium]|nr:endonuclease/exonuclease/phosphatase family protein [Bacteroidota bacterium]MBK6837932.1 endonuclease/exonuclease/phosphatase family protein [Bacteroidota bacterium]MBK9526006.1 endonuclease/exonuclease/phosphatase family protein [Bacteroidota bacterium]MBK9542522.1 endonuclease/exonuclease/phosphatase family protein [Bacteroidota bacterium]MBP6649611.1 endonuclease/exonuclease/phosphatase family protein [Bacteroidia bacterium]